LVSVGYHHACALSSGALYCWGDNANGQLGTGASGAPELSPVRVDRESWAAVEAGYLATCALNTRGEVYCWGDNAEGQVGQGDLEPETSPVRVELPGGALRISMLGSHACAILSDHSLYCWGRNWEGELGQDDAPDAPPEPWPLRVGNASDWLQIAAGEGHTCGLRRPGTVWCWGRNTHGQVGVQSATPNQYRTGQMVLPSDAWTQVSAGSFLSCGRRPDGSASCWGRNDVGQAVPGAADPQLSPDLFIAGPGSFDFVEGHVFHACGLDARAVAHCWGRNQEGQLGIGTYSASEPETQVGTRSWASLSVGRFGTCFVSTDNGIFCTGANDYGELGLGDTMRRSSPEQLVLP
jgi:alpha-tubulin suppressor-like RCC1 family protein